MTLEPRTAASLALRARVLYGLCIAQVLGAMLVAYALPFGVHRPDLLPIGSALILVPGVAMFLELTPQKSDFGEWRPLRGQSCVIMQELAAEHPQVQAFLEGIQAQGREVTFADLRQAEDWVQEQRFTSACRAINGCPIEPASGA